jgi:ParB family chromosome partitioning protein
MIVPLDKIVSSTFRRLDLGDIEGLARSIKEVGLLHPPILRPVEDKYEIVIGERRIEALRYLGAKEVDAVVLDISPIEAIKLALAENLARKDLTVLEEARGIREFLRYEPNMRKLSRALGRSKDYIRQTLLVFKLPEEYQKYVVRDRGPIIRDNALGVTKVRNIALLDDEEGKRVLCSMVLKKGMTRKEIERTIRESKRVKSLVNSIIDPSLAKEAKEKFLPLLWTPKCSYEEVMSYIRAKMETKIELKRILVPVTRFDSFRDADKYARARGGFCKGKVIYEYWEIYVQV